VATVLGKVRRAVLGIRPIEVTCARRGFGPTPARARLERIGATFLAGYHAALEEADPFTLAARLGECESELRGFAYEGAAMGLHLLDRLLPGAGGRLSRFADGPGSDHAYMVHVGMGWAAARLGGRLGGGWDSLDPLLRWLVIDGYGFHEGYFARRTAPEGAPGHLMGYARRAFDQGLGRSLWFRCGTGVGAIAAVIARLDPSRHPDLWSGVGLACAYAGGSGPDAVRDLVAAAGGYHPQVAQGVAFAAKARVQAGNPAEHTEAACQLVGGLTAEQAALLTDEAREGLPGDGREPAYECWRARIQGYFAHEPPRRGVEEHLRTAAIAVWV
jgi:hypothetical protein